MSGLTAARAEGLVELLHLAVDLRDEANAALQDGDHDQFEQLADESRDAVRELSDAIRELVDR